MTNLNAEAVAYRARALAQAHPLTKLARTYLDWAVAEQRTSQPLPEIGIWAGSALIEGYCVRRVEEETMGLPGSTLGGGTAAQDPQPKEEIPSDLSFLDEHSHPEGGHDEHDGHEHGAGEADHGAADHVAAGPAAADHGAADHVAAGPAADQGGPEDPPAITIDVLDNKATDIAAELRSEPDPQTVSSWRHADQADEDRLIATLNRIVASQVANRLNHWRDSIDNKAWEELEEYITWWVVKGYALRVAEVELEATT